MFRIFTAAALITASGFASIASANIPVQIRSAVTRGNLMPPVSPGSKLVSSFEIEFEACRTVGTRDFKVATQEIAPRQYTVEFQWNGLDCFGPTHRQTLTLTTNQLPEHASVTLKNPILIENRVSH